MINHISLIPLIFSSIIIFLFGHPKIHDTPWYDNLKKPYYTPPSWVFSIIWPLLYILMGISLERINNFPNCDIINNWCLPLIYFAIQLVLNYCWSILFFKYHKIKLALYDLILLILFTLRLFFMIYNEDSIASKLLLPYIIWLFFALYLNFKIYKLNLK